MANPTSAVGLLPGTPKKAGMNVKSLLWAALALQIAWAQPLPPAAQALYDQSQVAPRHKLEQPVVIEATSDGQSFVAVWKGCPSPRKWIVSLHGSRGFATEDMAVWQPYLKNRQVGLLCLQWRVGPGDGTRDYMAPETIYREIDLALQRLGVVPGNVMLQGFSRGSTQTFALAALDVFSRQRYFELIVASSGGGGRRLPTHPRSAARQIRSSSAAGDSLGDGSRRSGPEPGTRRSAGHAPDRRLAARSGSCRVGCHRGGRRRARRLAALSPGHEPLAQTLSALTKE